MLAVLAEGWSYRQTLGRLGRIAKLLVSKLLIVSPNSWSPNSWPFSHTILPPDVQMYLVAMCIDDALYEWEFWCLHHPWHL